MKALAQACNSFYLSPCTPQEVSYLIKKLKTNKAKRTSDIETIDLLNTPTQDFSIFKQNDQFLCSDGIYPDSLKVAKVIHIFKNVGRDRTTNYRPILLLS